jgi:hypothetical protein
MELTKEHFDKQLKGLVTKADLDKRLANVASKDDLLELATKNDVRSMRDDVEEIKTLVKRIDQRTDEDTMALARDVRELRRRVTALERK